MHQLHRGRIGKLREAHVVQTVQPKLPRKVVPCTGPSVTEPEPPQPASSIHLDVGHMRIRSTRDMRHESGDSGPGLGSGGGVAVGAVTRIFIDCIIQCGGREVREQ